MPRASRAAKERSHRPRRAPEVAANARETHDSTDIDLLPAFDLGAHSVGSSGLIARHAALLGDVRLHEAGGHQHRVRLLQRLQHGYGNGHVTQVLARLSEPGTRSLLQRACEAPPAPKPPLEPQQDPRFNAVTGKIKQVSKKEKQHAPPKSKVAEAQAAAQPPANDVATQAEAAQVDKMAQQKPGEFNKAAFIAAVRQAIDAAAPKNLSEAADFKDSGKAGQIKGQVSGLVTRGKQDSEKAIKTTNQEPPDTSKAKPKPVTPLPGEPAGPAPGSVGATQAIPEAKPADQVSMDNGPCEVNQEMKEANVTEEQLKKSNEPEFTDAVDAKKQAEANSAKAPQQYRATEKETLGKTGAASNATAAGNLSTMHGTRAAVLGAVTKSKGGTKGKDETKRAEITAKIDGIFNQTKTEVTAILAGLDGKVNTAFDAGEKEARDQFERLVDQRMRAYKSDRYSGIRGKLRWAKDKLFGMPSEVNAFYQEGRNLYLRLMDGVISRVADIVGAELGRAKARIAQGKQQVGQFVASQPKELQKIAKEAQSEIGGKFDDLAGEVNSKQDALVQSLAQKYVAARDALDSRIEDLKAANKGLVDKAKDAIVGVIKTILQLKDMLLSVLAKAADVIGTIIKDPIGFLSNLVGAIKQGLNQFVNNIGTHLKKGLLGWLFGALGGAGIQLPASFDLKGIFSLVLQVLGLTFENIRGLAVKLVGEKLVSAVEGTAKFFVTLTTEGPAALWTFIQDKIGEINLQETVLGAIKDFVITRIIMAGVTWLISMLNPASAFIKACKMIYDVIMFFIERGSQIMEFVNSILDGIGAIASGAIGSAANLVENSLAKILPLAISFLASLLGIGGIADKIKEIIEKIRGPINRAITSVLGAILNPIKKVWDKGSKFVGGLIDKGKALGSKVIGNVKGLFGGKDKAAKDKEGAEKPRGPLNPVEAPVSMSGASHTVIVTMAPAPMVEVASKRDTLPRKVAKAISDLKKVTPQPPDAAQHIADLKVLWSKGMAVERLVKRNAAAMTQTPANAPEIMDLVAALSAYGAQYKASDVDVFSSGGDDLRALPGYAWMQSKGLAEAFEARIVSNVSSFPKSKIKTILDVIPRFAGTAAFEAKVNRAVTTNRFWSPNDGFFWEIEDLHSIADIRFLDVKIGNREIDVLTGAGMLIDQKYAVELDPNDPTKIKAGMAGQVAAMSGAVGTVINGIAVTGWEMHPKLPIEARVRAVLASLGIDAHFK
jgi:hypothetical protein